MEEEQEKTLCAQLGVVDDSLFFFTADHCRHTALLLVGVPPAKGALPHHPGGDGDRRTTAPYLSHPAQGLRHHRRRAGLFPVPGSAYAGGGGRGRRLCGEAVGTEQPVGILICAAGRHAPLSGPGFCGAVPGLAGGGGHATRLRTCTDKHSAASGQGLPAVPR